MPHCENLGMNRSDKVTSDFLALNFGFENYKRNRGSVKTLGSMYAITIKQNINTAMFGFVKKQTCISKTLHAQFKAPKDYTGLI